MSWFGSIICFLRGGKLVLLKLGIESIPVYLTSIASVPKGILLKIRKASFQFLWSRSGRRRGIMLVKWNKVSLVGFFLFTEH
jgi:hypothetical protein